MLQHEASHADCAALPRSHCSGNSTRPFPQIACRLFVRLGVTLIGRLLEAVQEFETDHELDMEYELELDWEYELEPELLTEMLFEFDTLLVKLFELLWEFVTLPLWELVKDTDGEVEANQMAARSCWSWVISAPDGTPSTTMSSAM